MNRNPVSSENVAPPGGSTPAWKRPEKFTLVGLLALACSTILLVLAIFYVIPTYGFSRIHPKLPMIMGLITAILAIGVVLAAGLLVTVTLLGHDVPFSRKLRGMAVKGLLPRSDPGRETGGFEARTGPACLCGRQQRPGSGPLPQWSAAAPHPAAHAPLHPG
jgi:hypothetical protein